jgi:hypothetical protein
MTPKDVERLQDLYSNARYHKQLLEQQCNHSHDTWSNAAWSQYSKDWKLATENYKMLGKLVLLNTAEVLSF